MFRTFLLTQWRNIRKQKVFYLLNISGLTLGITASIFILLWIKDERSYEKMHKKADEIYLVHKTFLIGGETQISTSLPMPLGPTLKDEYPFIKTSVRVVRQHGTIAKGEETYSERLIGAVDPEYFDIFSFNFIQGDAKNVLSEPYSMVLTEAYAKKYFGDEDPIGQSLKLDGRTIYTVRGIIEDIVQNTYLDYQILIPYTDVYQPGSSIDDWERHFTETYLHITTDINTDSINNKFTQFMRSKVPEDQTIKLKVQAITDKHLHDLSSQQFRVIYIYIFSVIGFLILIIASINFTNATTYVSIRRSKEIGIRKINGAKRKQLMFHFLGETFFQILISFILGIITVELLLNQFNQLTGKDISIPYSEPYFILSMVTLIVITTLLAGLYPSILISAFRPIDAFLGKISSGKGQSIFRTVLLIFQFTISSGLIISTLAIFSQVKYMQESSLGFDKENLLYLPYDQGQETNYQVFREEALKSSSVISTCRSSSLPTSVWNIVRGLSWEGKTDDETVAFSFISGDEDLIQTIGLEILEGRGFERGYSKDSSKILINELAKDVIGFDSPIGKHLLSDTTPIEILGMFKNFHSLPMTYEMEPMLINFWDTFYRYMLIRIEAGNPEIVISHLENLWNEIYPDFPFNYNFMDERINQQYRNEVRIGNLAATFTLLSILITCIGLFAIAGLMAEHKTREIGIRKTMGATRKSIIVLYASKYIKWVTISSIISWPLAWVFIRKWLTNFSYQKEVSLWIFIIAYILSSVISILTILWHTNRIANVNPVESLKAE